MCLLPLAQSHVHSPDAGGTVKGDVRTSVSTQSPFPGGTSQLTSSILSSFPQYHLIFFSFQQHFFNFFSMHSPSSKVPKKCPQEINDLSHTKKTSIIFAFTCGSSEEISGIDCNSILKLYLLLAPVLCFWQHSVIWHLCQLPLTALRLMGTSVEFGGLTEVYQSALGFRKHLYFQDLGDAVRLMLRSNSSFRKSLKTLALQCAHVKPLQMPGPGIM